MRSSVEESVLHVQTHAGLRTLTLHRPRQRNAINPELRGALADALRTAATDPEVRAVILTGSDGNFCAGGDLGRFDDLHDPRTREHFSWAITDLVDSIERLEKPVVAAIDGAVTGAGLALMLACDWRVGAPGTRVLFREGAIGLIPAHGGLTRLVKLLGLARARELVLGGDELDGERALHVGLLSELSASAADLPATAQRRIERMLTRAPLSYGAAKRLLGMAADVDLRSGIVAESLAQTALLQSADHHEGLAAAREHRPPQFEGR